MIANGTAICLSAMPACQQGGAVARQGATCRRVQWFRCNLTHCVFVVHSFQQQRPLLPPACGLCIGTSSTWFNMAGSQRALPAQPAGAVGDPRTQCMTQQCIAQCTACACCRRQYAMCWWPGVNAVSACCDTSMWWLYVCCRWHALGLGRCHGAPAMLCSLHRLWDVSVLDANTACCTACCTAWYRLCLVTLSVLVVVGRDLSHLQVAVCSC